MGVVRVDTSHGLLRHCLAHVVACVVDSYLLGLIYCLLPLRVRDAIVLGSISVGFRDPEFVRHGSRLAGQRFTHVLFGFGFPQQLPAAMGTSSMEGFLSEVCCLRIHGYTASCAQWQ